MFIVRLHEYRRNATILVRWKISSNCQSRAKRRGLVLIASKLHMHVVVRNPEVIGICRKNRSSREDKSAQRYEPPKEKTFHTLIVAYLI